MQFWSAKQLSNPLLKNLPGAPAPWGHGRWVWDVFSRYGLPAPHGQHAVTPLFYPSEGWQEAKCSPRAAPALTLAQESCWAPGFGL